MARYQLCVVNSLLSETTRPRALIFDMKHCLINLYQVYSAAGPKVQNYPVAGGLGFEKENA